MGKKVDLDDLVSAADIAARLHLSHVQTVHTLRRRHADFPEPAGTWGQFHLWRWPDVEKWARATGRLPTGRT